MKPRFYPSIGIVLLFMATVSFAAIPPHIAHQGALTDTAGNPRPDGAYSFDFSLYDAESGGTALWSETKSLYLKNGMFSTFLGNTTPFGNTVTFNKPYWLGISVNGAVEFSPRITLSSSAYSFKAIRADTAEYAKTATSGIADSSGVAANAYLLTGHAGSYYQNAANINTGTLNDARLSANVSKLGATIESAEITDATIQSGDVAGTFTAPYADTAEYAKTATSGIADSSGIAANAYSLAGHPGSYYRNAANIDTGTLDDARLSANVSKLGAAIESAEIADATIQRGDVAGTFKAPYADTADVAKKVVSTGIGVSADTIVTAAVRAKDKNGLKLVSTDGSGVFVDSSGNVGIGTTVPSSKLHISGLGTSGLALDASCPAKWLADTAHANSRKWQIRNDDTNYGDLGFKVSADNNSDPTIDVMHFTHNGNVGVGTTEPGAELDVNGVIHEKGGDNINADYQPLDHNKMSICGYLKCVGTFSEIGSGNKSLYFKRANPNHGSTIYIYWQARINNTPTGGITIIVMGSYDNGQSPILTHIGANPDHASLTPLSNTEYKVSLGHVADLMGQIYVLGLFSDGLQFKFE